MDRLDVPVIPSAPDSSGDEAGDANLSSARSSSSSSAERKSASTNTGYESVECANSSGENANIAPSSPSLPISSYDSASSITEESIERSASFSSVSTRETAVISDGNTIEDSGSTYSSIGKEITLPWGTVRENGSSTCLISNANMVFGEYALQSLFVEFAVKAEKKVDGVLLEALIRPLSKSFQRGEDPQFDQLVSCLHSVAEHCLPSLLRILFAWYDRQNIDYHHPTQPPPETGKQKSESSKSGSGTKTTLELAEKELLTDKRNLAVDYLFALVLIEVLKQINFHPGHDDLVLQVENLAFKHFKYRDPAVVGPNNVNFHIVADLYAEVIGELAKSRFQSVRRKFMAELKELRFKETTPTVVNNLIALLMGMKFFRIKMVPIEEFEANFQFMQECATYFLEVKDKDVKHAMAGLLVEILMPVAASVKNEVNVPVLKNFVEMLYPTTLDMCAKKKHSLALFPLVTCLLCVSTKQFFLHNWHHFLTLCLSNLKNRDMKMSRVALESLYRLLWVYMIRIKGESNSATQSRLQSICNSLFPKGSKVVMPRDTPLNIFVKIIQFIAQERLDFAMKEIIFDLLSVGRPIRVLMPERMGIGLRAFLVIADGLQQKEGEPPMPRSLAVLPSGNTVRIKKTYVNKLLTDEEAKSIGMANYYPLIRKTFEEILKSLDNQVGRTMMVTANLNQNKEPDDLLIGERKPKIDLLKTCVAAIPRLLPDSMSMTDLVSLLSRLTVHMDVDLRGLAYQSIQTIIVDFKEHRESALHVYIHFLVSDISDAYPALVDTSLRMLIQFITAWKLALATKFTQNRNFNIRSSGDEIRFAPVTLPMVLYEIESLALVMLCQSRHTPRRLALFILKEAKSLREQVFAVNPSHVLKGLMDTSILDIIDVFCKPIVEQHCLPLLPSSEKNALSPSAVIDLQWVLERAYGPWNAGFGDSNAPLLIQDAAAIVKTYSSPPNNSEIWTEFISGLASRKSFLGKCPAAVLVHAWSMVSPRIQAVLSLIEPGPANENRASLLKTVRKVLTERDLYHSLWKNYLILACSILPPHSLFNGNYRCVSPDIALSTSSSESNCSEKSDPRMITAPIPAITAHGFYKMAVRLLRLEAVDLSDSMVAGMGKTNPDALKDLLEELTPLVKEAVDRKQENVRRKKRKDILRLQLVKLFYLLVKEDSIVVSSLYTNTENSITFLPTFIEYVDGTRMYLETETDKENLSVLAAIQMYFCKFIHMFITSFPMEQRGFLLTPSQRQALFNLCAGWTGRFSYAFRDSGRSAAGNPSPDMEYDALQAMSAVLCCGKVFDRNMLAEDAATSVYRWLDMLIASQDQRIASLAQETITFLLCMNTDTPYLLDWVVDRCYTGNEDVSDGCFRALSAVFCSRDYPCDQFSSIINLALMNTGCPRVNIQEMALELLQILDQRFFGQLPVYSSPEKVSSINAGGKAHQRSTLNDVLLSGGNYTRNQLYLSEQLAKLHPDLTMPIFSEVTYRFQTARPAARHNLLTYIIPWLYNLELVDFSLHGTTVESSSPVAEIAQPVKDHGAIWCSRPPIPDPLSLAHPKWGSPEATELVLNNLLYISAKYGDEYLKELEAVWSSICSAWPNNLTIVLRYMVIVSSLASTTVLPIAKRIVRYMAKARPDRLVEHLVQDLQAVDSLSVAVEKTQTPPFFRVTVVRMAPGSGVVSDKKHSDEFTSGTIHTKRHTHGEFIPSGDGVTNKSNGNSPVDQLASAGLTKTGSEDNLEEVGNNAVHSQPHPLPMPEYGGYFAPVGDLLCEPSAYVTTMHKCSFAISFLGDLLLDGINVAWTIHLPVMLHIAVLGLDSQRPGVYNHCRKLLENLLVVFACHNDHCSVARLLLEKKSAAASRQVASDISCRIPVETLCSSTIPRALLRSVNSLDSSETMVEHIGRGNSGPLAEEPEDWNPEIMVMEMIEFLACRTSAPLWSFEDVTAKVWTCRSVAQLTRFVYCLNKIFNASAPLSRLTQRWAEVAFQYGLNSSSRHYAGRSLQIYRALGVPVTFLVLSEILSRLVETVAEPGDDMQGYVTELMLTLESCTDTLVAVDDLTFAMEEHSSNERSPLKTERKDIPGHSRTSSSSCVVLGGIGEFDRRQRSISDSGSHVHRSFSAQTLVNFLPFEGTMTSDDKLSLLALLFWISMSVLESDYEHEFLLGLRLLEKVLTKLALDKPESQERIDKVRVLAKWTSFPGVQALILKGCTSSVTYENTLAVLQKFTKELNNRLVDPSRRVGFPLTVLALLPYQMIHFENPNELSIISAKRCAESAKFFSPDLESLSAVMQLYSERAFTKDVKQWSKCVIKYLFDVYHDCSPTLITFLIEVMEKGPTMIQQPLLEIIFYFLHYVDPTQMGNVLTDLLRVVTKFLDGPNWRECQNIIKLAVIRSSSLTPAGSNLSAQSSSISFENMSMSSPSHFSEDISVKKELPGRTMNFSFDVSVTPIAGRRVLSKMTVDTGQTMSDLFRDNSRRNKETDLSHAGWKRPGLSQPRTRERLVGLLAVCGQRVGMPKSPSIIFNQFGDVGEPSMESSDDATSTIVGGSHHRGSTAGENSIRDDRSTSDHTFTVFKDFDFLEYELESGENESIDNFNWGVRRSLSNVQDTVTKPNSTPDKPRSSLGSVFSLKKELESSDDEMGSVEIVEMLHDESSVDPADEESMDATDESSPSGENNQDNEEKDTNATEFLSASL